MTKEIVLRVRITRDLLKQIRHAAHTDDRTISGYARVALARAVESRRGGE